MAASLSPAAVSARLARLRACAIVEDVEAARARLARERPPPPPFEREVARRLAELRALLELTRHLQARPL